MKSNFLLQTALACLLFFTAKPTFSFCQDAPATELKLSGPRMGIAIFTGNTARRIKDPASVGGLNAKPVMSQFGYQFETAYVSNEKMQVLFEFFPNISGLDQGKFLPSISILHGIRFNKSGWELLAGPIVYGSKRAEGFFDENNKWVRLADWKIKNPTLPDPETVKKGLDTRGDFGLTTSFLISLGKNFRSGNLNFPLNFFVIPHPEGMRYGISVGFTKQD